MASRTTGPYYLRSNSEKETYVDVLGSPNSNLEEDRETVRDVHLPPRQSSREDEFVVPSSIAGATGVGCTLPPDLSDRVSNSLALELNSSSNASGFSVAQW